MALDDSPPPETTGGGGGGGTSGFGLSRDLRWQHRKKQQTSRTVSKIITIKPPATEIPMIAFLERPPLEDLVGTSGAGAGAGKKGVHGGRGLPQRSRFPVNEDTGKRSSDLGTDPFRAL